MSELSPTSPRLQEHLYLMLHITYYEQMREDKQVINKTTYTPKLSQAIQIRKLQSLLHYLTYLERILHVHRVGISQIADCMYEYLYESSAVKSDVYVLIDHLAGPARSRVRLPV